MTDTFKEYLTSLYSDKGIMIVSAAGNNGQNEEKWPGALPAVISVAAVDENRRLLSGSNWSNSVELAAPGALILSTSVRNRNEYIYSYFSGTSMA